MSDTTEAMRAAFIDWWLSKIPEQHHVFARQDLIRNIDDGESHNLAGKAWAAWQKAATLVAEAHPTPAAPAVTDSTHTGAAPDEPNALADVLGKIIMASGIVRSDIDGLTIPQLLVFGDDVRRMLAAQPSPERNDREPVVVIGSTYQLLWVSPEPISVIAKKHGLKVGSLLYTAPPPPAERHYCEPIAWSRSQEITNNEGYAIGSDDPEVVWGSERPEDDPGESPWTPLYGERCGKRLGSTLGVHTCTPPGDSS